MNKTLVTKSLRVLSDGTGLMGYITFGLMGFAVYAAAPWLLMATGVFFIVSGLAGIAQNIAGGWYLENTDSGRNKTTERAKLIGRSIFADLPTIGLGIVCVLAAPAVAAFVFASATTALIVATAVFAVGSLFIAGVNAVKYVQARRETAKAQEAYDKDPNPESLNKLSEKQKHQSARGKKLLVTAVVIAPLAIIGLGATIIGGVKVAAAAFLFMGIGYAGYLGWNMLSPYIKSKKQSEPTEFHSERSSFDEQLGNGRRFSVDSNNNPNPSPVNPGFDPNKSSTPQNMGPILNSPVHAAPSPSVNQVVSFSYNPNPFNTSNTSHALHVDSDKEHQNLIKVAANQANSNLKQH